jgi:basic membrane protein A
VTPQAFADPAKGREIGLSQFARGADVIFHASGTTGLGALEAAKEKGFFMIGVDSNQNPLAPGTMLTSMVKNVDNALFQCVKDVVDGHFRPGILEFGLAEDGIGYALDEHNRPLLTDAMIERVDALKAAIVAGTIQVPKK